MTKLPVLKRCLASVLALLFFTINPIFATSELDDSNGDVALSMVNIGQFPKYGVNVPFNITVTNDGSNPIYDVGVINYVPDGFVLSANNPDWTADPVVSNAFINTIEGPIPAGETALITINLTAIAASDSLDWVNAAEIFEFRDAVGGNICLDIDSTPDKIQGNDANDDDYAEAVLPIFDLAVKKTLLTPPPYTYGQVLTFRSYIYNQGNTPATQVTLIDYAPEGYIYDALTNAPNGWVLDMAGVPRVTLPNQINSGGVDSVDIILTLSDERFDERSWNNYTEIFSAADDMGTDRTGVDSDSTPNSNTTAENDVFPGDADDDNLDGGGPLVGEDEDDHDPAAPAIFDLALRKIQATALSSFSYNQNVEFTNSVFNQGNQVAKDVEIVDYIPCGLQFNAADNVGWTYNPATRIAHYTFSGDLLPNTDISQNIVLEVVQCYDNQQTAWDNYSEIGSALKLDMTAFHDIDSVIDSLDNNDPGAVANEDSDDQLDGGGLLAGEDEDDHDIQRIQVVDLALIKYVDGSGPFQIGDTVRFTNKLYNQGNVLVDSIRVKDYLNDGYFFDPSLNPQWTMSAGTPEALLPMLLFPEDSVTVSIDLVLVPADDETDYYNYAEISLVQDTTTSIFNNRFDDADSFVGTNNAQEQSVVPDGPNDDNVTGNSFAGGDSDDHDVAAPIFYDLALTKDVQTPFTLAYGEQISFDITVTNEGTMLARDIVVSDLLPCGFEFVDGANPGWMYDSASRKATYNITTPITPGASEVITIVVTLTECDNAMEGAFTNYAEISSDDGDDQDSEPDDDPENDPEDEDDNDDEAIEVYDLSLTKEINGSTTGYGVGDQITFDIRVQNEGGDTARNVVIVDYLPCGFSFDAGDNSDWIVNTMTDNPEYTVPVYLAPGDSHTASIVLTIETCDTGDEDNYLNGAEIASATDNNGDPIDDIDSTPDDTQGNEIDDEDDYDESGIDVYDLELDKSIASFPTDLMYGSTIDYEITVTNTGSLLASDIEVTDFIPCGLAYDPANNATEWNIDALTGYAKYTIPNDIEPGDSETVTIVLTVEPCDIPTEDAFNNKAEISVDNGDDDDSEPDDDPENDPEDEDDNDDAPTPISDLALTKEIAGNQTSYGIGDMITFDLTVENEGNDTARNVVIVDYLPCGFTFEAGDNMGWMTNAVSGHPEFTVPTYIAPGDSYTASIVLEIVACDTGDEDNYLNGAEIASATNNDGDPMDDIDSTPDDTQGNDPDGEDDYDESGIDIYDLELDKTIVNQPSDLMYGSLIEYEITVSNAGTLLANDIEVTDYIPCGLSYEAVNNVLNWSIDALTGYAKYTIPNDIEPGESETVTIVLTVEPCDTPTADAFNNEAEISVDNGDDDDSEPDDDPENDQEDEDDNDDAPTPIFDLALDKYVVNAQSEYEVSESVQFAIEVTNEGNQSTTNIEVTDYIPCGFSLADTGNEEWMTVGSYVSQSITSLEPGEDTTMYINLIVEDCNNFDPESYRNGAEISSFEDDMGNPGDDIDSTPDTNPNNDLPDEDDFDDAIINVPPPGVNIGGDVWKDEDRDGYYDTTEDGVPGITVNLLDCDGNFIASTTTGSTGFYVFAGVEPSDYIIEFDISSLNGECGFTLPNVGADDARDSDALNDGRTACITLAEDDYTNDAGLVVNEGSIGDYVFIDTNGNGIQDNADTPLAGVEVILHTGGGLVLETTITDEDGYYQFDNLPSADYYIEFGVDETFIPTTVVESNPELNSDVTGQNGANTTNVFTLDFGENKTDVDAGFYNCVKICGNNWVDVVVNNEYRDPTENGINGMQVNLYKRENGVWQLFETDYTGHNTATQSEDGYFEFCVIPGEYYVEFELTTPDLVQVFPFRGPSHLDSDITNTYGLGTTNSFIVTNGGDNCTIGAGFNYMFQVGNQVWLDENANGLRESNESPMEGVQVKAYNLEGEMVAETVTNSQGMYNLDYLQQEDYFLKFEVANMSFTIPNEGNDEEIDSDVDGSFGPNTTAIISGQSGVQRTNVDAGVVFSALPVDWLYVRGAHHKDFNSIEWATASEVNNSHFELQRSVNDLSNFETLEKIQPNQDGNTINKYMYDDHKLLEGVHYYRIMQVDVDGSIEYSEIVSLDGKGYDISMYPNPTTDKLNVNLSGIEIDQVRIYNKLGQRVKEYKLVPQSLLQVEVSDLNTGVYHIELMSEGKLVVKQRFIKS